MAKREDSGSGLRAGFSRTDASIAPKRKTERKAAPKPVDAPVEETVEKVETPLPASESENLANAPTITMQGVSGKKITGVVKVVKKAKVETEEAAKPAEETAPATAEAAKPAEDAPVEQPAQMPAAVASTPASPPTETVQPAAQEMPASAGDPVAAETAAPTLGGTPGARPAATTAATPASSPVETPAARQVGAGAGRPAQSRPAVAQPRPQRPQSGPVPRQPSGVPAASTRPQGGPGGYAQRSQTGRGGAGSAPRPQSGTPGRPVRRAPAESVPTELVGRSQPGRGNLTARDGGSKPPRRDDTRDTRRTTARGPATTVDKHAALKKSTLNLPDSGLTAALSDGTIIDTIFSPPPRAPRSRGRRRDRGSTQASKAAAQRAVLTHVVLPEALTVKEFAEAIKKTSADVIKKLIKMGVMATLNQVIDYDTAAIIANEYSITAEQAVVVTEEDILFDDTDDTADDMVPRPPVVVVMGHVDHGKTSLLDRIRQTDVAEGEAGGITQHIGAYMVTTKGRRITFLDTPGHEAFTTMRARGAQVTDIAILVVAADDGVMPQTIEAINHARAANTQIVVAINKVDLPGANIDRVKQELATRELIPEEWGGSTIMVPVSAKTGEGMDDLLEMLLLTADMMDLKSNPDKQAKGTVIEAKLDKGRGPVATLLVQRGSLQPGDTLVTGSVVGRVRAMTDYKGAPIKKAGPSTPVEIIGLPEVPEAGELFYAVTDEKTARSLVERRRVEQREQGLRQSSRMSLESLYSKMSAGEVLDLNLIVKADVQGSVEAVKQSLEKLTTPEIRVHVIHGAVGAITEGDVTLAEVANAIIIGFNVRPAPNVADIAEEQGVDLRMYRIIYTAIEDVQAAMQGMLAPVYKESILGHAEVRQVFRITGAGTVAGSYVTDGRIVRSAEVRLVRDGIVVHEGKLHSLKRFKDDVREVATGYECGISIERFNDIKEGDIIEAFEMVEVERK